ncbi:hypothetical protein M8J76_012177 [Diaphorina citri]|nr:hypothetical protein M8J75_005611 [Diaphorina citri]KAI5745563.1 hypothetical protein M8J76_012177 [Diaphorina citri]KAI5751448.1 hypothetical protein M8J77_007573 [Diaphorina citri]
MTIRPDTVKHRPDQVKLKQERHHSAKTNAEGSDPNEQDKDTERKLSVLETHGYSLGDVVGMGSYATVKLATSARHSQDVAIKIISKVQAPIDYLKKFLPREIEVVKGLKHPNLIRFLQAIETTHRVYIIMEYAKNGSLLEVIRKERYIDEDKGRRWFSQLADAIDYCHKKSVVHRDIKCENLLLDDKYNIKLSDFGFARKYSVNNTDYKQNLSETFCGSYAYASPEILKGVPYTPQQSDIWSMGVVLFAMVYGRLPFDDTNYSELLKQVQKRVVFPESPRLSSSCKALISNILSPVKFRIQMEDIRQDPWLKEDSNPVGKSKSAPEVIPFKKSRN